MAGPATPPVQWGTDATHPAGADAWSGLANKVNPGAAKVAAGWEPEDNPPAEHLNYVLHNFGQWSEYYRGFFDTTNDEFEYPSTKVRTVFIPSEAWRPEDPSLWSLGLRVWTTTAANAIMHIDLGPYLPSGAIVSEFTVLLTPNAARASGSRMEVDLLSYDMDFATPSAGASSESNQTEDDGTTNLQIVQVVPTASGDFQPMDKSTQVYIGRVTSGGSSDTVRGARVSFTDPGPRNY